MICRVVVAMLSIMVLSLASYSAATAQESYETYVVSPAINNYAILPGEPLPEVCQPGGIMRIMACRGEYEPASFVVRTKSPLKGVRIEVGNLAGAAGTLPADAIDVRAVQVIFRRVTDWPALTPWLLLHDPGLFVVDDAPRPYAIGDPPETKEDVGALSRAYNKTNRLTREAVDTQDLQPVDIEELRQFWITVHVPFNAMPGAYSATVRIEPENAAASEIELQLTVPGFELLPPMFEYSIYYPASVEPDLEPDDPHSYGSLSEEQYLAELRNMVAHGCTSPNSYCEISCKPDGTVDFTALERTVALCDAAGISHSKPLYLVNHPVNIVSRPLTEEEHEQTIETTRQIVAWARERGFPDVYFYAIDEASGETLHGERESIQAVHDGGGKVFVAGGNDLFEQVGDLLDLPILMHPGHAPMDRVGHELAGPDALRHPETLLAVGSPELLLEPGIQSAIKGFHQNGFKVFTYMDPLAGCHLVELHRRNRGLGLWKAGLDGTMTWAYTHITASESIVEQPWYFNMVFRAEEGVLDTLGWEGYREGVDDARYLTTLLDALEKADAAGRNLSIVKETRQWLEGVGIDADLEAWRLEMVQRIEAVSQL